MRIQIISLLIVLYIGACASSSRKTGQMEEGRTKVKIENQNMTSMTVYILKGTERVRLGLVAGLSTSIFAIPDRLMSPGPTSLRLLADPVGSRRSPMSEEFTVLPGDQIEMVIRAF